MLASYAFSPKTSILSRKAAVDFTFVYLLYRGRVSIIYRVFYMAALRIFTTFFYRRFHLISAYLAIHIVDLYMCWQPPILYCRSGALLA